MNNSVRKILLIEDNNGDVGLIREMLSEVEAKFALITAERLSSGLQLLQEKAFDVVLLDLGLPDSSGMDTFRKLQKQAPNLPIIVLTGLADQELAAKAISLGAQDYLVKGKFESNMLTCSILYSIERKRVEEALKDSESTLSGIASTALDAVILIDNDGNVSFWNDAAAKMFGYTNEEIIGKCLHSFIMPERHVDAFKTGFEAFRMTGEGPLIGRVYEINGKRKDGREFPVELSLNALRLKGEWNAIGIVRDISDRRRGEELLRESEERFRVAFENAATGRALTGVDGGFIKVNRLLCDMLGYSEQELVSRDFGSVTHPDDIASSREAARALLSGEKEIYRFEKRYIHKDGHMVWAAVSTFLYRNPGGMPLYFITDIHDITGRRRLEEEIKHMAQHDALTGLPNRRLFNEIISVELAQAKRHGTKLAVFFLDLDRFKEINDTLGHETGDSLLKEAAARLKTAIRSSDTIARIGGDEFNLILSDIHHPEYIGEVARKILNEIRKPFIIDAHELNVSTSIGISIFPDDGDEIDILLRYADIAMYHAKEKGRNNYQFYNPVINTRSIERMRLENSLRQAIERNEFRLHFQPLVDLKTGTIVSAEVLLRWQHPERGLLEPRQFFGTAEDIGFMKEIDQWVLKAAGRQIRTWIDEAVSPHCVTVNVSAGQFESPDLVNQISRILEETDMPPECLDIEITETTAMGNIENTIDRLQELRKMGVRVSIDDFGTGYSSLNHLKRLPIQKLKIDRSFVQDIATDSDDRNIISAVLLMAHAMRLKVVAEGVEGENQLQFLRTLQCDEAQGFFFSRPLPAEQFEELITSQ